MSTAVMKKPMWPNQERAVTGTLEAIAAGVRRVCVTGPTGCGKSRIACELIEHFAEHDQQTVLYTNRRMLVQQLSEVLERHGITHGIRAASYDDERYLPVQVSSIQTEHARVLKAGRWRLHDAQRVIVDEAHLQKGKTAREILNAHLEAGAAVIGLTATPIDLGDMYDKLVTAGTLSELRGYSPPALLPAIHKGPDEPDMKRFKPNVKTGEYTEDDVRKAIMTKCVFGRVLEHWREYNPGQRPSILFAPGVGESVYFAEEFRKEGIEAAHIDGNNCWVDGKQYKSDRKARKDILARSEAGDIKVICNRFVLREGVDAPWLYCGILATVLGSLQTYIQSVGRLLRYHPSMDHVVLQDHGGHWWRHGSANVDRVWDLTWTENMHAGTRTDALREKREPQPIRCPKCHTIRKSGPVCPLCRHEVPPEQAKMRVVIQEDGSLVEHAGDIYRPKFVRHKPDTEAIWRKMYFRAKRAGMTFRQAEGLFVHENRYWPPRDLPLQPLREIDWFKKVGDVPADKLR